MENYKSQMWEAAATMFFLFLNAGDSPALLFADNSKNRSSFINTMMVFLSATVAACCFILNLLLFHIYLVRIFVRQPPPLIADVDSRRLRRAAVALLQLAVALKAGLMALLLFSAADTGATA